MEETRGQGDKKTWRDGSGRAPDLRITLSPCLLVFPAMLAHAGGEHDVERWWLAWNLDPLLLSLLGGATLLYVVGLRRLWREAGVGRGISVRQAGAFGAGMAAVAAALVSPVDALSAELSSVHMVQHMVLMMVAAPLLMVSGAVQGMMWGLICGLRRGVGSWLSRFERWRPARYVLWQPLVVWLMYAVTLWVWHLPALYQGALRNEWVHELQHVTFFLSACLFWRVLLDPLSRLRLSRGVGVLYLFTTSLHATVLGVFMALSPRVWYGDYAATIPAWGLTPLEDQQLAGLIMWMPACMIYALLAAVVLVLWLHDPRESGEAEAASEGGAS